MTKTNCCKLICQCAAYPLTDCKGYSQIMPEVAACRWMRGYATCTNIEMIQERKKEITKEMQSMNRYTDEAELERARIEKEEQEAARIAAEVEAQESEQRRTECEQLEPDTDIIPGDVIDASYTEEDEDEIDRLARQLQRWTSEGAAVEIAIAIIEGEIENVKYEEGANKK